MKKFNNKYGNKLELNQIINNINFIRKLSFKLI